MRHLLILVLLSATTARADAPSDAMHTYFKGEKTGAWVFFGTGLASLGAGGTLSAWATKRREARPGR